MNRRGFVGMTAAAGAGLAGRGVAQQPAGGIRLGVATYSLRAFQRDLAIQMIRQLNTPYADVKEFHLRYNDSPEQLAAGRKQFEKAGLQIVAGGTITLEKNDDADIRRYFDYVRNAGIPIMVIAPTRATLPAIEKMVKEYGIRTAIHNHGPEDKHFPTPQSALEAVRDMDPRMGLCIDIGHTARTGKDVVESIAEAGPRLFEMHVKDLKDFSAKESQCVVGEGKMPFPQIFTQLRKMNYTGVCSLEYEIDEDNPLPGMQRSFSYMRGVIAGQAA